MRKAQSLLLLAALSAAPALVAQGPRVIGLTAATPMLVTQDTQSCQAQRCLPPIGPAMAPFAGGTACGRGGAICCHSG